MSIETIQRTPHLRRFTVDDWRLYKSIRLEALKTEAYYFASTYTQEAGLSDVEWRDSLAHPDDRVCWGLYNGDECIGLTAIRKHPNYPGSMVLAASYIRREYRGRGLSALFYQTRLNWAREHGYTDVYIAHRKGNDASRAANQKFGFKYTHSESTVWPDGSTNDKLWYRLEL
jgi:RimJ/RimL family protein N-acetyltransferase